MKERNPITPKSYISFNRLKSKCERTKEPSKNKINFTFGTLAKLDQNKKKASVLLYSMAHSSCHVGLTRQLRAPRIMSLPLRGSKANSIKKHFQTKTRIV